MCLCMCLFVGGDLCMYVCVRLLVYCVNLCVLCVWLFINLLK